MNTIFSSNLKKFRQQKNLTQEQVAEVLGVNAHTVSRWECNTTLPDVTILPEIAKLYCVTIDDLFKESSVAYENYAQRLSSIYEATREPEDFIRADFEFKKLIKKGNYSTEDLRLYGILHHFMMQYCIDRAIDLFNKVLEKCPNANEFVYWKTKNQKMLLFSQIGRNKENIESCLRTINNGSEAVEDWRCLIEAFFFDNDNKKYSKTKYYEEIGEYKKCYELMIEIIEDLKRDGLDIEAAEAEKELNNFVKIHSL